MNEQQQQLHTEAFCTRTHVWATLVASHLFNEEGLSEITRQLMGSPKRFFHDVSEALDCLDGYRNGAKIGDDKRGISQKLFFRAQQQYTSVASFLCPEVSEQFLLLYQATVEVIKANPSLVGAEYKNGKPYISSLIHSVKESARSVGESPSKDFSRSQDSKLSGRDPK